MTHSQPRTLSLARYLIAAGLAITSSMACDLGGIADEDGPGSVEPPGEPPATVEPGANCSSGCHGDATSSAPPNDTQGQSDRALQSVGAHRIHLETTLYRQVACSDCHQVPAAVGDPGHLDGDGRAEITFSSLNPDATYDPATGTCQNMYCHSDGWSVLGTARFNSLDPMACGSCHAVGRNGPRMSGEHGEHLGEGMPCSDCHSQVVDQALAFVDASLHVNGVHEVLMPSGGTFDPAQRRCSNLACHGDESW